MLRHRLAVIISTSFSLVLSANSAHAATVGVIASVVGNIQVGSSPNAKMGKASVMQALADGSTIKVAADSRAIVVLFHGGARYELAPGSLTSVSSEACKSISGAAPKALAALQIRQAKLLEGSRVASGRAASTVLRGGEGHIELQSLSATSVLSPHPVFEWSAIPGATSYKVLLWDDNNEVIWQGESQVLSLTYPDDAAILKPDTDYLWTVTTTIGDNSFKGEGIFRILDADKNRAAKAELEALDNSQDEAVLGVLRAEIYARYELWDDAIGTYQQLLTKYPESDAIHDALTQLLAGQSRTGKPADVKSGVPNGVVPAV